MRKMFILIWVSFGLVAALVWPGAAARATALQQTPASRAPGGNVRDRFIGTWRWVGTGSPEWIGFLMFDRAGYMGATLMQRGRPAYAGDVSQRDCLGLGGCAEPTPEEARAALAGYTSYFGTFSVTEIEGVVTYRLQGSLNPNMDIDQARVFELSGNRLTLTPRGATSGQSREIWERVPDLPKLTPEHRRFIGFWKMVSGEQTGMIIYTASGHMAVHAVRPGRKRFMGAQPTPEEAKAALATYSSYFGRHTVHEAERVSVHHQDGIVNPGQVGTNARRYYEFAGKRLILKTRPGATTGANWERVSAEPGPDR